MSVPGPASLPIPEGARLLHIGPHKTGTSSVQGAFHLARRAVAAQGVHYAGAGRQPVNQVQAAIGAPGSGASGLRRWRRLVREIDGARASRVVVSSEWFADAAPAAISRIVDELGGDRVHVAVTVRSLARVLPSQWQQHVAAGYTGAYEDWLRSVFQAPDRSPAPAFWWRHRHDELIARWAAVVGPSRVSVIVADDTDHDVVLRAFERLVGLARGTLVADPDRSNRSLTLPEAEQMRALNAALAAEMPAGRARLNLGLFGAAAALRSREPHPGEPRIRTPGWALEAVPGMAAEVVEGIRSTGARIVGDLDSLLAMPAAEPADVASPAPTTSTWLDVTTAAALGVLASSGLARGRRGGSPAVGGAAVAEGGSTTDTLEAVPTERLVRVVLRRFRGLARPTPPSWRYGRRGGSRERPGSTTGAPSVTGEARRLTEAEGAMLEAFTAALREAGVPARVRSKVVERGALPELLAGPAPTPGETPWPQLGARLAVGALRAAGVLPARDGRVRLASGRRAIETLDVAGIPTGVLVLHAGRRLVGASVRRVWRRRRGPSIHSARAEEA